MSAIHKLKRTVETAIGNWSDYIANGNCKSYDEYVKSCATRRSYMGFLTEIDEAVKEEMNEGSDHE